MRINTSSAPPPLFSLQEAHSHRETAMKASLLVAFVVFGAATTIAPASCYLTSIPGGSLKTAKEYFVDGAKGNDSNPGTENLPFKTLTHARDVIRQMKNSSGGLPDGGVVVSVRAGDYSFTDGPLILEEQDSGLPGSPIIYQSYPSDPPARLTGGVSISLDSAEPVSDPAIIRLLPPHLRDGDIIQVDLKKLGIMEYGELESGQLGDCANNKLELSFPNRVMVLARYPNISPTGVWQFLQVQKVVNSTSFQYSDQRISQWKNTSSLWLHGFWSYDWADNYVRVERVDASQSILVTDPATPILYGLKSQARFYALNILEELDDPNEYYVDRGSGVMYLFKPSASEVGCVSVGESVVTMDQVSFVSFIGFTLDCTRQTTITATSVSHVELVDLEVSHSGDRGISLSGYNNTILNVTVKGNGCGGIEMSGGDQKSLTRGNNLLSHCTVSGWSQWKRTYQPGISWSGVGNNYTHNNLSNAPHAAILGGGNDCLFEYNSLSNLCYEVTDSGAFYTGRSWIDRGNIIRHSLFTNITTTEKVYLGSPSVQAIYLDDQMSGYLIYNNTFINCHAGSFIGGGRRNQVLNNTYLNCSLAVHVDNRGMSWQAAFCKEGGTFDQQLQSVNYQSPPWSIHYPELVHIFQDHPCIPVYNVVEDNQYCGGEFIDISPEQEQEWMDTVKNNSQHC